MFQLIVAVISIALIAALAIASIFYGGDAFNKGSLKANVTTLVNGGQQIAGAQALYRTDFAGADGTLVTLVPDYLTQIPAVSGAASGTWTLDAANDVAVVTVAGSNTLEICQEAAKQAGGSLASLAALEATAADMDGQFGCYGVADETDPANVTGVSFGFKY